MLSLQDKWIWDFWLAKNEDIWHIYFLQADKSLIDENLRHWNVSIGHATSTDLKEWNHLGSCLEVSEAPAWDDMTTWTGSVIQDDSGLWHLFYTGNCKADNGLKQRIGVATSTDMHNWKKVGMVLDLDPKYGASDQYEEYDPENPSWGDRAMRDPWVMRNPKGEGWVMYFTGRVPGELEANNGAAVGYAKSDNLIDWTLEPPVYNGGFGQMEVPQVLNINGQWYCLFCNAGEHWSEAYTATQTERLTGSHYLTADDPEGPWEIAPGPFLDAAMPANRYAGKLIQDGDQLLLMGFLHDDLDGNFIGKVGNPIPVLINDKGALSIT